MAINENDSRVRRTKKLIRQGLAELSLEKSIDKITVKELTERIDINRGTFYLHYSDIEDLIECIQNELYDGFCRILSAVTAQRIKQEPSEILFEICNFLKQNCDVCSALLFSEKSSALSEKVKKLFSEKCSALLRNAYPDLNAEKYDLICEYCIYGGIGIIRSWLKFHPEKTPRQISELWLSLTNSGIKNILESDLKEALQK